MPIVEYKLELTSECKKKPDWIVVGGKFKSPLNHSMIGYVAPKERRDYYVPPVEELSREDFIERQLQIHEKFPEKMIHEVKDDEGNTIMETKKATKAAVKKSAGQMYDNFLALMEPKE